GRRRQIRQCAFARRMVRACECVERTADRDADSARLGRAMKIEPFRMERMQSTYENLVAYDMSESGVRPLTLRELIDMGFDMEEMLDVPLGYSQSNGTLELRESLARLYLGTTVDNIEVTNGTAEANYVVALTLVQNGDRVALETPNYMQYPGLVRSL